MLKQAHDASLECMEVIISNTLNARLCNSLCNTVLVFTTATYQKVKTITPSNVFVREIIYSNGALHDNGVIAGCYNNHL